MRGRYWWTVGVISLGALGCGPAEQPFVSKVDLGERPAAAPVYELTSSKVGTSHGSNPRHGFTLELRPAGLRLDAASGVWQWELLLRRYGCRSMLSPVPPSEPETRAHLAVYNRRTESGERFVEWFRNEPGGLEHGFTLTTPPCDGADLDRVVLELELGGDLGARLHPSGEALRLTGPHGERAHYRDLKVEDADGRRLPAELELDGDRLAIVLDATGARFPIAVDPTIGVEFGKLTPTDTSYTNFGADLAISGTTLAAAAPSSYASGATYVFTDNGGLWTQQARVEQSDANENDEWGYAVAVTPDIVAFGVPGDNASAGVAYAHDSFFRSRLIADDPAAGDQLGRSIAIDGNTIVVGAPGDDDNGSGSGSAYVFSQDPMSFDWTQQAKLLASDGKDGDAFGSSVALRGDVAVIGAPGADDQGLASGKMYAMERTGSTWFEVKQLIPTNAVSGDAFGSTVDINAVQVFGASPGRDEQGTDSGAVYAFDKGGPWNEAPTILAGDGTAFDRFGASFGAADGLLAIGAPGHDELALNHGAVYVLSNATGTWTETTEIVDVDGAGGVLNGALGSEVDTDGQTIIAGAYYFTQNPLVWELEAEIMLPFEAVSVSVQGTNSALGLPPLEVVTVSREGSTWQTAGGLHIRDDGLTKIALDSDTLVMTNENEDWETGCAWLFQRAGSTWTQTQKLESPIDLGRYFGRHAALDDTTMLIADDYDAFAYGLVSGTWISLAPLKAANNGRIGALAVHANTIAIGAQSNQIVRIYLRNGSFFSQQADLTSSVFNANSNFGSVLALENDTLVVGAPGSSTQQGYVGVFTRSGSTWTEHAAQLIASDGVDGDSFGQALDLRGDNLLVGASGAMTNGVATGAAYLFQRSGSVWAEAGKLVSQDITEPGKRFGSAVALGTDIAFVGAERNGQGSVHAFSIGATNGEPCVLNGDCATKYCVDGVCCDTPCTGPCEACSAAKKGAGADGLCWFVAVGTDPDSECSIEPVSTCGQTGECDGSGSCQLHPSGTECSASSCASVSQQRNPSECDGIGNCTDQGSVACQPGYACTNGACNTTCNSDSECVLVHHCTSGSCVPDLASGAPCDRVDVCASGFCVDGYCCERACSESCETCDETPGSCTPIAVGQPGTPSCEPYLCDGVLGSCPAICDSDAACALDAYCTAAQKCLSKKSAGQRCDPPTDCVQPTTCVVCEDGTACVEGVCCASSSTQSCVANGEACSTGDDCASGYCVDRVCCSGPCTGQCEACDVSGSLGECVPVVGRPHGTSRPPCSVGTPENPCSVAECDGTARMTCEALAGSEVPCRSASCTQGVATLVAGCDGAGQCRPVETIKCEPYVCRDDVCGSAPCQSDSDCAPKFRCDPVTEDCVAAVVTCDGDHTLVGPEGSTDCTPYRCTTGGVCISTCGSQAECVEGYVCRASGLCEKAEAPDSLAEDGGCGCRVPVKKHDSPAWVLMSAALLVAELARRRRREGPSGRCWWRAGHPGGDDLKEPRLFSRALTSGGADHHLAACSVSHKPLPIAARRSRKIVSTQGTRASVACRKFVPDRHTTTDTRHINQTNEASGQSGAP